MKKYYILILFAFWGNNCFSQSYDIDFFLNNAKENSPVLKTLNNNSELFSLDLQRIKAIYSKPQISADANILISPIISRDNGKTQILPVVQDATNYYGYDLAYTDGGQYQAGVTINQPLFNKNKISVYEQSNNIKQQSNLNRINLTVNELEYYVKYQYLLCLSSQKMFKFNNEYSTFLKDEIKIMYKLVETGIYQQSDLTLLKIEQKNYSIYEEEYKSKFEQNFADLLMLCGIKDTSVTKLEDLNLQVKSLKTDSLFIQSFKYDSLNFVSSQKEWNLQYKPQISAYANAGMNAIYLPDYKRFGFGFGIKFSWLLYDGKQKNIIEQQNKIKIENNSYQKQNFITKNYVRKQNLLTQISSIQKQIELREEQLIDYDYLLKIYKLQLSQGRISIVDFADVLKKVADTKKSKVLLDSQKTILINTFNYWNR